MCQPRNRCVGILILVMVLAGPGEAAGGEDKPVDAAAAEEAYKKKMMEVMQGDRAADPQYDALKKAVLAKEPTEKPADPAEVELFIKEVAALTPEEQVKRVVGKLKELNPEWDRNGATFEFAKDSDHGRVIGFALAKGELAAPAVKEIWPIRALVTVEWLNLGGSKIADLEAVAGLPLTALTISRTKITSLAALKRMQLTKLKIDLTKVSDLAVLKEMPLSSLDLGYTDISDLSPLAGMKLTALRCGGTPVSDLTPLKGMPLVSLDITHTKVNDLAALKGMPLTSLSANRTAVSDLAPLSGMSLSSLNIGETKVADLTALKGMPLTSLVMNKTEVTELTALVGMPLKDLYCDYKPEYVEVLQGIGTLKNLNGKPPEKTFLRAEPKKN